MLEYYESHIRENEQLITLAEIKFKATEEIKNELDKNYTITLTVKNATINKMISKVIGVSQDPEIPKDDEGNPIPDETASDTEDTSEYHNIIEGLPEGLRNWLNDRSQLDVILIITAGIVLFLFILNNKKGKKILLIPAKKRKKKKK